MSLLSSSQGLCPIGTWQGPEPAFQAQELLASVERVRETAFVVSDGRVGVAFGGQARCPMEETPQGDSAGERYPLLAILPPLYPEWLGDRSFCETHGCRFPYVTGDMANGIASERMVIEAGRAGLLGFFGAAGLSPERVEAAIDTISTALPTQPWGSNLIHSPHEPALEAAIADLYLRRGVRRVSAAAFVELTAPLVRYAASGLVLGPDGEIIRKNHLFAKISRPGVARRFLSPPPQELLSSLLERGLLTRQETQLARELPLAEDLTVEADSGGHTDNQALPALLPMVLLLRDQLAPSARVGAAGGLGTPQAVAAAFAMGAAYVLTGSVNQSAVESGLHADGRALLALASLDDVIMAPAADMFEMGVNVQVLKRGTLFGVRARKLYALYRQYDSLDALPAPERSRLEREILQTSVEQAWAETARYWSVRDRAETSRAESDPKHKMALVFRSYLGQASRWAISGHSGRRLDHQIWCGPAMGSFNAWVEGSFLAPPERRSVVQIARNLMEGAAVITRAQQLRSAGAPLPAQAFDFRPRPLE